MKSALFFFLVTAGSTFLGCVSSVSASDILQCMGACAEKGHGGVWMVEKNKVTDKLCCECQDTSVVYPQEHGAVLVPAPAKQESYY